MGLAGSSEAYPPMNAWSGGMASQKICGSSSRLTGISSGESASNFRAGTGRGNGRSGCGPALLASRPGRAPCQRGVYTLLVSADCWLLSWERQVLVEPFGSKAPVRPSLRAF
jgi:hypothetical protein